MLTVKKWFADKISDEARKYNTYLDDYDRENEDYDKNEVINLLVLEKLGETEKAIKVKLATGKWGGSEKGWTTWVPKSVITSDFRRI